MIHKKVAVKHIVTVALGGFLAACGSNPTMDMDANQVGEYLGYSSVAKVESIPEPPTFDLEAVNSKTAVMETRFSRNYLILFGHSCPEAGFSGAMKTTATGGQLDANDSIIIDGTYCRIREIYLLN